MSSFTNQLIQRHSGQSELVKPRQRSLFEPSEPGAGQSDFSTKQDNNKSEALDLKNPDNSRKEKLEIQPLAEKSTILPTEPLGMLVNATRNTSMVSPNNISPRESEQDWLNELKTAANTWLQPETKPVIRVSIGRLEVRTNPKSQTATAKSSPPPQPRMSLEDYLNKQKNAGK